MELEELKSLWKKHGDSFQPRNEAEIAAMLNGKSNSIISKLKRNVWLELTLTIVAGIGLLIYAITLDSSPAKNISIAILILFLAFPVYYIKKLTLLNRFNSSGDNIRTNLEKLVRSLSSYLRFYRLSYTILYPVYFCLGVIFGGLGMGSGHFFDVVTETRTVIMLLVLAVVFYFSSSWLVSWLIKKLYGNHLENLRTLLNDIHDEAKTP